MATQTTYVCFDFETTGLSKNGRPPDEIIAIGWWCSCDQAGGELLCMPTKESHPRALAVHGLSHQELERRGATDLGTALHCFCKALECYDRVVLVAHNGRGFDTWFLRAGLKAWDMTLPTCVAGFIDTYVMTNKKLDFVAGELGVSTASRAVHHGALVDSQVLAKVFEALGAPPLETDKSFESVEAWLARTARVTPPPTGIKQSVTETIDGMLDCLAQGETRKRAFDAIAS